MSATCHLKLYDRRPQELEFNQRMTFERFGTYSQQKKKTNKKSMTSLVTLGLTSLCATVMLRSACIHVTKVA